MSDLVNVTLLDSAISFIQQQLQAQNMTISVLSNLADIPVNTINNLLYRRTHNPGFEAVASMVYTLGGSMDALANKVTVAPENTSDLRRICAYVEQGWMHHSSYLAGMYQKERKTCRRLFLILVITYLLIFGFMIRDACNENIGYIRYSAAFDRPVGQVVRILA